MTNVFHAILCNPNKLLLVPLPFKRGNTETGEIQKLALQVKMEAKVFLTPELSFLTL
jgi:hypothetical protein